MSSLGRLVVTLEANVAKFLEAMTKAEHTSAKFAEQTSRQMRQTSRAIAQLNDTASRLESAFSGAVGGLARLAAAAGGIYLVGQALRFAVEKTDEFRVGVISVAATMTDLAEDNSDVGLNFARNLEYAKDTYEELERVAARHFSTGQELQEAMNILIQKGVMVRKDDIEALATIVDKIKLMTRGQQSSIQIAQELRSILDGQAKATSQVASLLKDQLGAEWDKILQQHREAGDLLQFIAGLWPGLQYAVKEVENTFTAQSTTLLTNLSIIARQSGIYDDIVKLVKDLNQLLENNRSIVDVIAGAWAVVKEIAHAVSVLVQGMVSWLQAGWQALAGWRAEMSKLSIQQGAMAGLDIAPLFVSPEAAEGAAKDAAQEAAKQQQEAYKAYLKQLGPTTMRTPPAQPEAPPAGGGGGRAVSIEPLLNLIDSLQRDLSRLREGSLAEIEAWYDHVMRQIEKYRSTAVEAEQAIALANEVRIAKQTKVEEEFAKWYASAVQDRRRSIDLEEQEYLRKYAGRLEWQAKIQEVYARKRQVLELGYQLESMRRQQEVYEALSGATPILNEQLSIKAKLLEIEKNIALATLERERIERGMPQWLYEEARAMLALLNQLRQYNLERERWKTEGWMGGLKGWSYQRLGEMGSRDYEQMVQMMRDLERGLASAISSGLINMLRGREVDWEEFGWMIAEAMLRKLSEQMITSLFDIIAQWVAGMLGVVPPMEAGAVTAAATLQAGGAAAGAALVSSAMMAASYLAMASPGSLGIGSLSIVEGMLAAVPFQHGGIVKQPTLGLLAESGPEAVIPLSKLESPTINVTVVNNTGVPMEATVTPGDNPGDVMVTLDRLMAAATRRGGEFRLLLQEMWGSPRPYNR